MKTLLFPTLEEALYLYDKLIDNFGGSRGVIDHGLLESALIRPRSGYYSSLSEQGAALLHSLAMNHCFVDGNKRMAFALTAVFFQMNGYVLKVEAEDAEEFIVKRLIAEHAQLQEITEWLETHLIAIDTPRT